MPRRDRGGSGVADKPIARTQQRRCGCGELIASSKKRMCWECEGKAMDRRKRERKARKAAR
jgi:hypothetical protein